MATERTVVDNLFDRAAQAPGAPAILAPGADPLAYGGLVESMQSTGRRLAEFGVNRSDCVAMLMPNGPAMATALLGVVASAAVAPLNPQYTADELHFYFTDLAPRVLIVDDTIDTPARDVARLLGLPVVEHRSKGDGTGTLHCEARAPSSTDQRRAQPDDVALLLHTSGTTSRPKLVPLSHANLSASARNVADSLRLTPEDRSFNLMPLFHIHGLVAALLATLESGGSVICTPGLQTSRVVHWMHELRPTWYTAVPTIHRSMIDALAQSGVAPPLRLIRSSSAALPATILASLEEAFRAPVIEAYGMTEAAHQMTSNPWSGQRKPGSVGLAAGPEVALLGVDGITGKPGEIGEIVIRGPNVMTGYLDNPAANAAAFADGWFRTGDQGSFDEDGYLTITGRLKEIVNRGGEKVAPTEVEEALLAHPEVDHAVAFAVSHPRLGEDIAAAVVLRDNSMASRAELRRFVATQLAPFKVPHRIVFVSDIPKGPTGKVKRIGMADRLDLNDPDSVAASIVEPRDHTEQEIVRIFTDVLHLDAPVSVTDDFLDLGADSLHLEELLAELETSFHRSLPASALLDTTTPERIAVLLRAEHDVTTSTDPIVVPIQSSGSRPPLFCVMRAGALLTARHFVRELGTDQPIFGLWMPAMHGDRDAAGGIEEIAASCRRVITDVQPTGPYYLFGYSTGGLVAYEMARQFSRRGATAAVVVMADTPFPAPLPTLGDHVAKLFTREGPPAVARRVRDVVRRLPGVRSIAEPLPPTQLQRRAEEFRAAGVDLHATIHREREYVSEARPPAAPIVLLRCRHTMEMVSSGSPVLGWERYVGSDWQVHEVPGSHDSMLGEPHVHVLAKTLASCLREAQERDSH